jgi:lipoprotein-anchoring transpeptidase ErfK/SrfK
MHHHLARLGASSALAISVLCGGSALAQPLAMHDSSSYPRSIFREVIPQDRYQLTQPDEAPASLPENLRRQVVSYSGREAPGTIIVDTANTYLYYVLGGGRAMRYGIGVGREGFSWSGVQSVARKTEWPDWHPPAEMIERQPYLPRFMAGGPGNPLGARALYLGNSMYRIHGTNMPSTIGQRVSSGCIRMLNEDVIDLYNRVNVGAKVVVLPESHRRVPAEVAQVPQSSYGAAARYNEPTVSETRSMATAPAYQGNVYRAPSLHSIY